MNSIASVKIALSLGLIAVAGGAALGQQVPIGPTGTPQAALPQTSSGQPPGVPISTGQPASGNMTNFQTIYTQKPPPGSEGAQAADIQTMLQKRGQANESLIGVETTVPPELASFLSTAPAPAAQLKMYEETYDKIGDLLRKRDPSKAVVSLFEMSACPWDSGISEQLANRVLSYWDMMRNQAYLASANAELEKHIKTQSRNGDLLVEDMRKETLDYTAKMAAINKRSSNTTMQGQGQGSGNGSGNGSNSGGGGGKNGSQGGSGNMSSNGDFGGGSSGGGSRTASGPFLPSPTEAAASMGGIMGKLELADVYFQTLQARIKSTYNEKLSLESQRRARADFQGNIKTLFMNGRHYHAKLAADFYRVVMGDGDLPASVAEQAANAAEIVQRIRGDAPVIAAKVQAKRLASASQMLKEDFTMSRMHPALQALTLEVRMAIQDYFADLQKLQNMAEARDFTAMETLTARLESEVVDFDATKPRAYVNAVKIESNMHLGLAKLSAQQKNFDKVVDEFKAASMSWPANPALELAANEFFKKEDTKSQSTDDFDRAASKEEYREIFDKQLEYAIAVHGDSGREEKFKKALNTVKAAEIAIEKARLFEKNHDTSGAWETLELAAEEWPEDSKVNKRRADLSVKASEFVKAISTARDAEAAGDIGFSLAWFLNAQQTYPPSQMANEAIDRLSAQLLGRPAKMPKRASTDTMEAEGKNGGPPPSNATKPAPDQSGKSS